MKLTIYTGMRLTIYTGKLTKAGAGRLGTVVQAVTLTLQEGPDGDLFAKDIYNSEGRRLGGVLRLTEIEDLKVWDPTDTTTIKFQEPPIKINLEDMFVCVLLGEEGLGGAHEAHYGGPSDTARAAARAAAEAEKVVLQAQFPTSAFYVMDLGEYLSRKMSDARDDGARNSYC